MRKIIWAITLLAVAAAGLIACINAPTASLISAMRDKSAWLIASAMGAFVFSQVIRGIRLHLVLSGFRPKLTDTLRMQIIASFLGHTISPMIQEATLLTLYGANRSGATKQSHPIFLPAVLAIMATRLFDFLIILPLLLFFSPSLSFYQLFLVGTAIFIASSLFVLPLVLERIERHTLMTYHGATGVELVKLCASVRAVFLRMKIVQPDTLFLITILTLAGWGCEIYAIGSLLDTGMIESFRALISRIANINSNHVDLQTTYDLLVMALGACALIIIIFSREDKPS